MADCTFCKIVKGESPSQKVYETENVLAFLSIGPVNKGHALVIPRYSHDGLRIWPPKKYEGKELEKYAWKIRDKLA